MTDKNGREIKTGMIVQITGAYFANDNGLYFVDNSPGDPTWCGRDHSLKKICKNGRISTAKRNICFWPIGIFISDAWKAAEARRWNKEHAQIEVVPLENMDEVRRHFEEQAQQLESVIRRHEWDWGKDSPHIIKEREMLAHYRAVAASIQERQGRSHV